MAQDAIARGRLMGSAFAVGSGEPRSEEKGGEGRRSL